MISSLENMVKVEGNNNVESIEISLPSKPEYVSIARLSTSIIANKIGFNIEDIEDMKIAVGEACNNAVTHGKNDSNKFNLLFRVYKEKLEISIIDQGKGFHVEKCPNPDPCKPKEGGLGIFIIRSLMDDVEVKSSPGKGTEIKMIKYLKK